jgi:23S rRNA G2069 N7-methylase RlmK/C1962 C5-methylase RlmI
MTGMFAAQRELVASGRRIQLLDRTKKLGKEMRGIRDTLRVSPLTDVNTFINEDVEIASSDSLSGTESSELEKSLSSKEKRSSTFKDMFMAMSTKRGVVRKVVKKLGRSNADRLLLHELESLNIEQYDDELMVRYVTYS